MKKNPTFPQHIFVPIIPVNMVVDGVIKIVIKVLSFKASNTRHKHNILSRKLDFWRWQERVAAPQQNTTIHVHIVRTTDSKHVANAVIEAMRCMDLTGRGSDCSVVLLGAMYDDKISEEIAATLFNAIPEISTTTI